MAQEFLLATQFATAAAMFALAGWLLWLKFSNGANRAFALFLSLTALQILFVRFRNLADDPWWVSYWGVLDQYMFLAAPLALVAFAIAYLRPRRALAWKLAVLAVAISTVVLFLQNHCLSQCDVNGQTQLGPLSVLVNGGPPIMGAVGLVLVWSLMRKEGAATGNAPALLAGALLVNALFDGLVALTSLAKLGWAASMAGVADNVWQAVPWVVYGSGALPAVGGIAVLTVYLWRRHGRGSGAFLLAATGLAAASAVFIGLRIEGVRTEWAVFLAGLWNLVLPATAAYALLRHRLFDIDVALHGAIKSSTIAAVFAAAFFVGSELLEQFIPTSGLMLGLASAALITLALHPVQAAAERLADLAVPDIRDPTNMSTPERKEAYRRHVAAIWADGVVTTRERRFLARLQQRLALDGDTVSKIEADAGRNFHKEKTKRRNYSQKA